MSLSPNSRFRTQKLQQSSILKQSKRSQTSSALRANRNHPPEIFNPRLYVTAHITEQDVVLIKQVFDDIDSTGRGILAPSDIKFALHKNGINANKQTLYDIVAEYDEKEAGGIGFPEFMAIMTRIPSQVESKEDIRKVFRKYDRKNKGYIDTDDILNIVKEVQEELTSEQLLKIMEKASCKTPGRITLDEFYRLMTRWSAND